MFPVVKQTKTKTSSDTAMENLVISFAPTGTVTALHMDAFDLGFLGRKDTYRQTDIVFNSSTQLWDLVYLEDGHSPHCDSRLEGFESYETARQVEVRWLNACRLASLNPVGIVGLDIMSDIRQHQ